MQPFIWQKDHLELTLVPNHQHAQHRLFSNATANWVSALHYCQCVAQMMDHQWARTELRHTMSPLGVGLFSKAKLNKIWKARTPILHVQLCFSSLQGEGSSCWTWSCVDWSMAWWESLLGPTDCPPTTQLIMVLKYSLLSCTIKKDPSLSVWGIFRLLLWKLWET